MALEIGVEAWLFHAGAAQVLVESGLAEACLRLMFEPPDQTTEGAIQTPEQMEAVLETHHTRIGFEDTLCLPTGKKAQTNADLIKTATQLL